jgi:hypothetical protein
VHSFRWKKEYIAFFHGKGLVARCDLITVFNTVYYLGRAMVMHVIPFKLSIVPDADM